jgi:hypothetical protein
MSEIFVIDGLRVAVRLSPQVRPILDTAIIWAIRSCHWVRVTSGNDHVHAVNSLHYTNQAVDLMSDDLQGLNAFLLELGYRTLYRVPGHYNHVHVEFVPREPLTVRSSDDFVVSR